MSEQLPADESNRSAPPIRPYEPPRLVVYGSLAKLTHNGSGSEIDRGTGRRRA